MTTISTGARAFVRALMAATSNDSEDQAVKFAQKSWGTTSMEARILERAANQAGDVSDIEAASRGFIELVQERSVIGRVGGWRRQRMHVPVLAQTSAVVASWTQEGTAKPLGTTEFERHQLDSKKITAMLLATQESMTAWGEIGERDLANSLADSVAALETSSLLDPDNAGVANTSPASVTYGLTPIASTGTPAGDLKALVNAIGTDLETSWLVMTPETAVAFHAAGFEGAGARGGEIAGIPLATSSAVPANSNGDMIALINPNRILLADDGIRMERSTVATIEVEEGFISLFQQNLVALLAERPLNWKALPGSVAYIDGVTYA
jgi:hypothetical protein